LDSRESDLVAHGAQLLSRLDNDVHSFEHPRISLSGIRERPRRKRKLWYDAPADIPKTSRGMLKQWNGLGPSKGARRREENEEVD
jgi:hypothetical protein